MWVRLYFCFSNSKTHGELVSFLLLTQQKLCHRPLDLGRPVPRQHLDVHVFSDNLWMISTLSFFRTSTHKLFHTVFFIFLVCLHGFSAPVISYSSVFCLPFKLYPRIWVRIHQLVHQCSMHPSTFAFRFCSCIIPGCNTTCTRGSRRVLCRHLSPRFEPFLFGTLYTSLKLRPVVSVANTRAVCDSSFGRWFFRSRRKVRHKLRLCVQQECHTNTSRRPPMSGRCCLYVPTTFTTKREALPKNWSSLYDPLQFLKK